MNNSVYAIASRLLRGHVLRNLSTLKYLDIYREHAHVTVVQASNEWATLVEFPTSVLSYDTATYPEARKAIFLNGTSAKLKHDLLARLVPDCYLLRLNEELDLSLHCDRFAVRPGYTFISYTCSSLEDVSDRAEPRPLNTVGPEALELFSRNGYTPSDLARYSRLEGAAWFGVWVAKTLASVCFVFQNHANTWEIAGVHTHEALRRRGYATTVVRSALRHLLENSSVPRYEAEQANEASIGLARYLGMNEFLRIKHFLLEPR